MGEDPRGDWMVTASGRRVYVEDPCSSEIVIDDIAHALSMLCRFNGHCREFYSVAQHSVLVSCLVPPSYALAALLHDAPEAYLGDVIRPVKGAISGYSDLERRWWWSICQRFLIAQSLEALHAIKEADRIALLTEKRDLVADHEGAWRDELMGYEPDYRKIVPLSPAAAKVQFLNRFWEVRRG